MARLAVTLFFIGGGVALLAHRNWVNAGSKLGVGLRRLIYSGISVAIAVLLPLRVYNDEFAPDCGYLFSPKRYPSSILNAICSDQQTNLWTGVVIMAIAVAVLVQGVEK
jgi:ABC-type multidrug transport system permease subunit